MAGYVQTKKSKARQVKNECGIDSLTASRSIENSKVLFGKACDIGTKCYVIIINMYDRRSDLLNRSFPYC